MFSLINKAGSGAILFINQELPPGDLLSRITELRDLQGQGIAKAPQPRMDLKDFGIGAQMLHDLDISKIRLISNSGHAKRVGMIGYGLDILEHVNY
jgi:3,4-dihydroxy 2-butanone 4-phosphate synthase/GTP cyclohydrolase II